MLAVAITSLAFLAPAPLLTSFRSPHAPCMAVKTTGEPGVKTSVDVKKPKQAGGEPFRFGLGSVVNKLKKWRSAGKIEAAKAALLGVDTQARRKALSSVYTCDLAEIDWEDHCLPSSLAAPKRDLKENAWEMNVLPPIGGVSLEAQAPLPAPLPASVRTRALDSWERQLPGDGWLSLEHAPHALDDGSWEERLLP